MTLVDISRALSERVASLRFHDPVCCVYHPLEYARAPHEAYLERCGRGPKQVMLLGMNPGPFGMAQTGVPFGDVGLVRDWLGNHGARRKAGARASDAAGARLRAVRARSAASGCGASRATVRRAGALLRTVLRRQLLPARFPGVGAKNRTPDKLPKRKRGAVRRRATTHFPPRGSAAPEHVIGVGGFAEARARRPRGQPVRVGPFFTRARRARSQIAAGRRKSSRNSGAWASPCDAAARKSCHATAVPARCEIPHVRDVRACHRRFHLPDSASALRAEPRPSRPPRSSRSGRARRPDRRARRRDR